MLTKADYADRTPCPTCLRKKPRKFFLCNRCYSYMPGWWRGAVQKLGMFADQDAKFRRHNELMEKARKIVEENNNRLRFPVEA